MWADRFNAFLRANVNGQRIQHFRGQLERGDAGHLHYQLFVQYRTNQRGSVWKRLPGGDKFIHSPHFEQRRGTVQEAEDYCGKEETRVAGPWCAGELRVNMPGKRSDLDDVAEAINDGATFRSIRDNYGATFIRYHQGIERSIKLCKHVKALDSAPDVRLFLFR